MKKIITLTIILIIVSGCAQSDQKSDPYNNSTYQNNNMSKTADNTVASRFNKYSKAPGVLPKEEISNKKAVLNTDKGIIEIKLFDTDAPIAVSNFVFLIKEKFYDGIIFHRREEGFVIQGGDPLGEGYGGPGYKFEDEPVTKEYKRGIVAMANSGPDTNGSQFFIMLSDYPLPPSYTIFGEVISGMEAVDKIKIGDKIVSAEIKNQ